MMDYTKLTYAELGEVVSNVWKEVKRRNPIGVNFYADVFDTAAEYLTEIHDAEQDNPTSEAGPGIDKGLCLHCECTIVLDGSVWKNLDGFDSCPKHRYWNHEPYR